MRARISLDAVVDDDDFVLFRLRRATFHALLPAICRPRRDFARQVLPFHAGRLAGALHQRLRGGARRVDDALLRSGAAEDAHQPPRVDPLDADHAIAHEKLRQGFLRAPVRRLLADAARDEAGDLGGLCLLIAAVDAVIAHLADREGDQLAGVRGVGEDLLVAGVRGVEDDLAHRLALGADGDPLEDFAAGERQRRFLCH